MDHLELAQLKSDLAADMSTQAELDAEAALARNADNLTSGTVADARIASTIARDSEVAAAYQPLDADLTTIAGLTATTDNVIQSVAGSWASRTMAQLKTALALVKGDVGLGSVDNTADTAKPVSTAQQTALDLKQTVSDIWRIDRLLSLTPDTMSTGAWTNSGTSGFNTAGSASAAYNEVWYANIVPGTWTIEVAYLKGNNGGIITYEYSLDGSSWVTIAASVDHYAASQAQGVASKTGVVISAASRFYLRVSSAGTKNASSSAYYAVLYNMTLRRTA